MKILLVSRNIGLIRESLQLCNFVDLWYVRTYIHTYIHTYSVVYPASSYVGTYM